jgi:hypothetical protein
MNSHVTDDELILHFYGESPNEAPRIDQHLGECGECQANWATLQRTMQMVDSAEIADAPAGFERVMWAKIQPQLPPRRARLSWWSPRAWAPIAGLAAVIALAFVGGRFWPGTAQPMLPSASTEAADARITRERVLLSALRDHFEQTEMLLVEIKNTPDGTPVSMSFEQASARDLVAAGRLYRETAKENGDLELTAVLEDLERVLVDVASSPERMTPKDLQSLRARIEDDSLLFKVRALTTAVREREKSLLTQSVRIL